jgi:hypothetical protein
MQFFITLTIFLSAVAATPVPAATNADLSLNEARELGQAIGRRSVASSVCDAAVSPLQIMERGIKTDNSY